MPDITIRGPLLALLAAALIWRAAVAEPESSRFGLRTSIGSARVEITLALPLLCVRVSAHVVERAMALSASSSCSRCHPMAAPRSWS